MTLQQLQTVAPPFGVQLDAMLELSSACQTTSPQQPCLNQQWIKVQQDVFVPAGLAKEASELTSTLPDLNQGILPLFQEAIEGKIQFILEAKKITRKTAEMEQLDASSIQYAIQKGILQSESAKVLLKKTPLPINWPWTIALMFLGGEALTSAISFGASYITDAPLSNTLWGIGFVSAMLFALQVAVMFGPPPRNYSKEVLEAQARSRMI